MTECDACGILHLQSKEPINFSTSVFILHMFVISNALYLNVHNEGYIMTTGNGGVCGLPRDASCFREEYINRN